MNPLEENYIHHHQLKSSIDLKCHETSLPRSPSPSTASSSSTTSLLALHSDSSGYETSSSNSPFSNENDDLENIIDGLEVDDDDDDQQKQEKENLISNSDPNITITETTGIIDGQIDQNLLDDNERILKQMLKLENKYIPVNVINLIYRSTESSINENMRSQLTEWMFDVCEGLHCQDGVFTLSVQYLDRLMLLMGQSIPKSQLQLICMVCMLIASKIKQCQSIDPNYLSFTCEYAHSASEIMTWEFLALRKLNWDVSSVIANDYIDYIMAIMNRLIKQQQQKRNKHNRQLALIENNHQIINLQHQNTRKRKYTVYTINNQKRFKRSSSNNSSPIAITAARLNKLLMADIMDSNNNSDIENLELDDHNDDGFISQQYRYNINSKSMNLSHHHFNQQYLKLGFCDRQQSPPPPPSSVVHNQPAFQLNQPNESKTTTTDLTDEEIQHLLTTLRRHSNTFITICTTG